MQICIYFKTISFIIITKCSGNKNDIEIDYVAEITHTYHHYYSSSFNLMSFVALNHDNKRISVVKYSIRKQGQIYQQICVVYYVDTCILNEKIE